MGDDSELRIQPSTVSGNAFDLGFGTFSDEFQGSSKAITLTFQAKQEIGFFDFILGDSIGNQDSFYGTRQDGSSGPLSVEYVNAQVQVSAIPLPGAVWLLLSSFVSLGLMTKRKSIVR